VTLDIEALKINEGGVYGVIGPNGSGKSTLLKVLACLEPRCEGLLLYDGKDTAGNEIKIRKEATYLLQNPYLLKRSVYENIAYGLRLRQETSNMRDRIYASLRRVGLEPGKFAERPWFRLSGGEAQRVALAARLALYPRVLLLDEPTANVDESSAQLVKEAAVSAWKERGTTVIVATHDLVWLYEVSTDIINLYHGRIVGYGAENIVTGPWEARGEYAVRVLSDGQTIYGARGSESGIDAAVINPSDITLSRALQPRSPRVNALTGTVTQMTLERSTGHVLVSADVGGIVLKSRVPVSLVEKESLCPAAVAALVFSPDSVRWL